MLEYCPFDSQDKNYRNPTGAVCSGQTVNIRYKLRHDSSIFRIWIICHREFEGSWLELPMGLSVSEDGFDIFSAELITGNYLGLIWYYFKLERFDGSVYYYGNNDRNLGGKGRFYDKYPNAYQLTVYEKDYTTPEWYGSGVTYHIFPDRFARTKIPSAHGLVGDRVVHEDWNEAPEYRPDKHGEIRNNDFFGGSIDGIMSKLRYIKDLGVTTIYLSPIFEAASNHRYDTSDYLTIDPMFGTNAQFEEFCAAAKALGIHILLDGVFNHTGNDSIYFNQKDTYSELGAAQSQASKYYDWYTFEHFPDKYSAWWGIYTLPQVNEENESYLNFIIKNPDSVARRWIRAGASGWRLDVADELPDSFIEKLRNAVKAENKDAVVIGEVWEDASNKISYDIRRRHILGKCLDGVMNYPFRDSVIGYLLGGDAKDFRDTMENIRENYPRPAYFSLMNSMGTHDTPRILTVLGVTSDKYNMSKDEKCAYRMSVYELSIAKARLRLGSLIMFCFPGSPTVFYGDEAGLYGFEDPFNRRTYPWGNEDKNLIEWYQKLGAARNGFDALRRGEIEYIEASGCILVFSRETAGSFVVCAVNSGGVPQTVHIPWKNKTAKDYMTGIELVPENGMLIVNLPPTSGMLIFAP